MSDNDSVISRSRKILGNSKVLLAQIKRMSNKCSTCCRYEFIASVKRLDNYRLFTDKSAKSFHMCEKIRCFVVCKKISAQGQSRKIR